MVSMDSSGLVRVTQDYVRTALSGDASGHDWWHVYRVWSLARTIAQSEGADMLRVELAALLHDIDDWKFNGGDALAGGRRTKAWLEQQQAPADLVSDVVDIVDRVSFRGAGVADEPLSLEGRIVQDADRLDALGAVGIARVFAFGGSAGRQIFDPTETPQLHRSAEDYRSSGSSSITHFHEKLFLLKDRMHTAAGKRLAEERHAFMVSFVQRFELEWDGIC